MAHEGVTGTDQGDGATTARKEALSIVWKSVIYLISYMIV